MLNTNKIIYRRAVVGDVPFMTWMLLEACRASGVFIHPEKLHEFPETEIYIKGWSPEREFGVIAETESHESVGAVWIRFLPGAGYSVNEPLPEITIAVAPPYRRMGIASELMSQLYELSAKYQVSKLSLGVQCDNDSAIKLYEKQGWVKDGLFRDYIMMSYKITGSDLSDNRICKICTQ